MFEWDEEKNKENKRKHGVSFEETLDVFKDEFALSYEDSDHKEQRWKVLGSGKYLMVLVVVYTYRKKIRIISARKATKQEKRRYEEKKY